MQMFGSSKDSSDDAPANPTAASARSAAEAKLAAMKESASKTSMTLQASQEARRRRKAAAAADILAASKAGGGSSVSAMTSGESTPAASSSGGTPAAAAEGSGAMGVVKSLLGSIKGGEGDEKEDTKNPFQKKKKPEVAIIDPEAYYAGSRPAMALGYGATGGEPLKTGSSAASSKVSKKKSRRGRRNVAPANTMNMNLAPRRNSVHVQGMQGHPLKGLRIPKNRDQTDAAAGIQEEWDESSMSSGSVSLKLAECLGDDVVPVRSSNVGLSQFCANICKSWKKILVILLLLAAVISITIIAVMEDWVGTAPETLTAKAATSAFGARKTKEFHTQYEWPRNGQDKDEAYRTMLHDRTILAHNAQAVAGGGDREMMDNNQEGPSSPHQLGFAYEQTGDGPWRVGYRDGLGGVSKTPPDIPSQKYVIMYQQEQQRRKDKEDEQQQQDFISDEDVQSQAIGQDQSYRRAMQQPMGVTNKVVIVDKVVPEPVNLP